jgi:hypothetical protein
MHACRWRAPNLHEFIVFGRGLADERGRPCFPYRRQLARLLFLKLAALIRGALPCGSSFAHRDMTVALRGLNDDRDIVTKSCKDHDQPRFAKLMEEKQEASADRASPARTGEIRDGSIDFRRYALEQLNELRVWEVRVQGKRRRQLCRDTSATEWQALQRRVVAESLTEVL